MDMLVLSVFRRWLSTAALHNDHCRLPYPVFEPSQAAFSVLLVAVTCPVGMVMVAVTFSKPLVVVDLVVGVGSAGTIPKALVVVDLVVGVGSTVVAVVAKNPAAGLEHAIVVVVDARTMMAVVAGTLGDP